MTDNKPPPQQQHPPKQQQQWASLADRLNPNRRAFDAQLKSSWKSLSKKEKKRIIAQDRKAIHTLKSRGTSHSLPFEADTDDHCETSSIAYAHIAPILTYIAEQIIIGKKEPRNNHNLQIYDPYYCAGTVVQHLNKLGFENVYNQPEDFYQVIQDGCVPQHDVVVTNPPYSGDHFERLIKFCVENNKPALLLIPEHLSKKKFVQSCLDKFFFLTPAERYFYWTPEGVRQKQDDEGNDDKKQKNTKKSKQHKNLMLGTRNSPFASHWFICTNPVVSNDKIISLIRSREITLLDGCNVYERQEDIVQANRFRKRKEEIDQNDSEVEFVQHQEEEKEEEEERQRKRRRKKKRAQKEKCAQVDGGTDATDGSNPFF